MGGLARSCKSNSRNRVNDPAIARPKRKAPEAHAVLKSFAADYRQRQEQMEQAADGLRADRDRAIRSAYGDGMAMSEIASVLAISHQRVSQIVRSHER
jgi:DNA-directed RNA polymerase specialized sigma24 family protein